MDVLKINGDDDHDEISSSNRKLSKKVGFDNYFGIFYFLVVYFINLFSFFNIM